MSLFTSDRHAPSIAHVPAPADTPESLFQENLLALHRIETELADANFAIMQYTASHKSRSRVHFQNGEMFARMNALTADPQLQALESAQNKILRRRADLYAQHGSLKIQTGRTR